MYELIAKTNPLTAGIETDDEYFERVLHVSIPPIEAADPNIPLRLGEFIGSLLKPYPNLRPRSFRAIHEFLNQVQEVVKIINEANSGNWLPIAVVGSLFGIIVLLLLYIYNRDRKISVYKHRDIEEIQSRLSLNNEKLTILVNRHDVKLEEHDKRLAKIER